MRILGFSEMWPKLQQEEFTTFRFPRKDKDWYLGEVVQVVYKPRSKERKVMGTAEIVSKEERRIDRFRGAPSMPYQGFITRAEAIADGFNHEKEMLSWLEAAYKGDYRWREGWPMNKLTLRWS